MMECRLGCAACCIAPSISSPIPGMPHGKRAGERCVQLDERDLCKLFGKPERPAVCSGLQPSQEMCGNSREQAMHYLGWLERETGEFTPAARWPLH
ncbi:YkgJ family cysteine cluster protein [Chitinimonas sp. JJ19]|uniref:YkgJ family cysteine cluster protein n=1 Tax=Chitinimonas sp. JJ19 TaxID=3109352 RepID=UPI0030024355